MRLRRDTIRVEESAFFSERLSVHRIPAKRWRALCHLGSRAPRGPDRYKRRAAQNYPCEADALLCDGSRHARVDRGQETDSNQRCDEVLAWLFRILCVAARVLAR